MQSPPAHQLYPDNQLADTMTMTTEEVGAYSLLAWVCWREDGLPDDLKELALIARMPAARFDKSWKRIKRCFVQRADGSWESRRLAEERIKQAENRKKRQAAGSKGAEARWQTHSNAISPERQCHESAMANDGSSSSSSSSLSSSERKENPQHRAKRSADDRGCRLPDDFGLTSEMREWAATNTPQVDVDEALMGFIDYWRAIAGARGRKLDWAATFRNWLRNVRPGRVNANGKNQQRFETASDRNQRNLQSSHDAIRQLQAEAGHDNNERPALLLATGSER
jgi:uncharacterized protein YdaU (DUF1376 family)